LDAAVLEQDSARGLGILGMKERASFFAWDLKICSAPGDGTRICLKVPMTKEVWDYA